MVDAVTAQNLLPPGLAGWGRLVAYEKGERIFTRNTEEETIALVNDGLIYLCAENERYARSILGIFCPGDLMDAAMLLPLSHGVCYFMTKYAARLTLFPRSAALEAAARNAQAAGQWSEQLAAMAQNWMWHGYILQQRGVRQRILAFFRREAERQGSVELRLPLPQADLAEYLGVDRAAMARELTRMKQEGLLYGARRNWTLLEQG